MRRSPRSLRRRSPGRPLRVGVKPRAGTRGTRSGSHGAGWPDASTVGNLARDHRGATARVRPPRVRPSLAGERGGLVEHHRATVGLDRVQVPGLYHYSPVAHPGPSTPSPPTGTRRWNSPPPLPPPPPPPRGHRRSAARRTGHRRRRKSGQRRCPIGPRPRLDTERAISNDGSCLSRRSSRSGPVSSTREAPRRLATKLLNPCQQPMSSTAGRRRGPRSTGRLALGVPRVPPSPDLP